MSQCGGIHFTKLPNEAQTYQMSPYRTSILKIVWATRSCEVTVHSYDIPFLLHTPSRSPRLRVCVIFRQEETSDSSTFFGSDLEAVRVCFVSRRRCTAFERSTPLLPTIPSWIATWATTERTLWEYPWSLPFVCTWVCLHCFFALGGIVFVESPDVSYVVSTVFDWDPTTSAY